MAKLPKKSTMIQTITRVKSYVRRLEDNGVLTPKECYNYNTTLTKLLNKIKK